MKKLYTTALSEALGVKLNLEQEGVEVQIHNEGGAFYAVGLPTEAVPLEIHVPPDQYDRARKHLESYLDRDREITEKKKRDLENQFGVTQDEKKEFQRKKEKRRTFDSWVYLIALVLVIVPYGISIYFHKGINLFLLGVCGSMVIFTFYYIFQGMIGTEPTETNDRPLSFGLWKGFKRVILATTAGMGAFIVTCVALVVPMEIMGAGEAYKTIGYVISGLVLVGFTIYAFRKL